MLALVPVYIGARLQRLRATPLPYHTTTLQHEFLLAFNERGRGPNLTVKHLVQHAPWRPW